VEPEFVPGTCPYPEPDQSTTYPHTPLLSRSVPSRHDTSSNCGSRNGLQYRVWLRIYLIHTLWGKLGNRHGSIRQSDCLFVGRLLVSVRLATSRLVLARFESPFLTKYLTIPSTGRLLCLYKVQPNKQKSNWRWRRPSVCLAVPALPDL